MRIHKLLSTINDFSANMHPIIELIILAAAFHLSGLLGCSSVLPTFAKAIDFEFTSCTTPTPQEIALAHLFRQILMPLTSGQEAHVVTCPPPKVPPPSKNPTSGPAILEAQEIPPDRSTLALPKIHSPPILKPTLTPLTSSV